MYLVLAALTVCAAEYKIEHSQAAGKAWLLWSDLPLPTHLQHRIQRLDILYFIMLMLMIAYFIEILPFTIRGKGLSIL